MDYIVEVKRGPNRHERRKATATRGKKNTRGFYLGYNKKSWDAACARVPKIKETEDAGSAKQQSASAD